MSIPGTKPEMVIFKKKSRFCLKCGSIYLYLEYLSGSTR